LGAACAEIKKVCQRQVKFPIQSNSHFYRFLCQPFAGRDTTLPFHDRVTGKQRPDEFSGRRAQMRIDNAREWAPNDLAKTPGLAASGRFWRGQMHVGAFIEDFIGN
jgi:hypothetical protein